MSPPPLSIAEEEGHPGNVTLLASSASAESVCLDGSELKERNYMGLSDCSSVDSSTVCTVSHEGKTSLNLKATELRLGLPGSQSPERNPEMGLLSSAHIDEKPFFPLHPSNDGHCSLIQKNIVSSNKRGFSDVMDGFLEGKHLSNSEVNAKAKEMASHKVSQERPHAADDTRPNCNSAGNNSSVPARKAQVVGWPPIRSFRKNSLASTSKNTEEVDGKAGPGALFVKVSMDGAPYLRKVDLRNYSAYQDLSSALEKMFSCFIIGQYGSHGAQGKEMLRKNRLKDLMRGSEYVLTYEDKDDDWMLVGDVPWEMFIGTCKRLRIMKSCDAIGLAPRVAEKCKYKN